MISYPIFIIVFLISFSKKKYYDGSSTLKMVGSDCKLFESNIDKFVRVFLKDGEDFHDNSFEKMRQVITLYHKFKELAVDIRAVTYSEARVKSFPQKAEEFFRNFKKFSMGSNCTARKPYLHLLREHIGNFMQFWGVTLGWGYGYFNCNAGEHLNKKNKQMEIGSTNLDEGRFHTVMRNLRIKQYYFPEGLQSIKRDMVCSACKQPGHNKKNKSCVMHPSQPELYFSESDTE